MSSRLARRRALILLGAGVLAPAAAVAAPPGPQAVIAAQIEAFLRDDFAAAFAFASPGIQSLFGTPENFGRMVRQGYPMVWRPESYAFAEQAAGPGTLRQAVTFVDASGRIHVADYHMLRVDGRWRIDGVTLRPSVGTGA